MRSRKADSSSPTPPAPAGSLDNRSFYELTDEGRRLLELHESATGTAAHRQVVPGPDVAAALEREARLARKKARAREARAAGRRSLTVCGRWTGRVRIPDLRMSGWWLRAAGFDLGQAYEVEVAAGKLLIRAV